MNTFGINRIKAKVESKNETVNSQVINEENSNAEKVLENTETNTVNE